MATGKQLDSAEEDSIHKRSGADQKLLGEKIPLSSQSTKNKSQATKTWNLKKKYKTTFFLGHPFRKARWQLRIPLFLCWITVSFYPLERWEKAKEPGAHYHTVLSHPSPLHTLPLPLSPLPPDRKEAPFSLPPRRAIEKNFTSIPQQGCLPTCSDNESFVGSSNKVTSHSQTRQWQWRDLWVWTKVEQEPWTTLILNLAASQGCPHFTVFMYVYICVRTCVYVYMCAWEGRRERKLLKCPEFLKDRLLNQKWGGGSQMRKYIYRCQHQEEEDGGIF